jgi:hypothetical protein
MRRRNRKKQVDGFVFPVPFAGLLVIIATLALTYVWMGCRCESLGKEIKALEQEREVLQKKYLTREYTWTQMKSPRNIEKALARFNIKMIWPANNQIVRLQDTPKKGVGKSVAGAGHMQRNVVQGRKQGLIND